MTSHDRCWYKVHNNYSDYRSHYFDNGLKIETEEFYLRPVYRTRSTSVFSRNECRVQYTQKLNRLENLLFGEQQPEKMESRADVSSASSILLEHCF